MMRIQFIHELLQVLGSIGILILTVIMIRVCIKERKEMRKGGQDD